LVTILLIAAGGIYLGAVWQLARTDRPHLGLLPGGILLGLAMRGALAISTPIQEDDFYRYLWDGAVAARGANPYRFSPEEVRANGAGVPRVLGDLARESGPVIERINFPELTSVYPPAAQAAFALAHAIQPWSIGGLRVILFLFDAATMGLVVLLLREMRLPLAQALIYWWNPVLLKETYNSAHMDVVALPFALAAVWFALRGRPVRAGLMIAVAAAIKLWPVLLLPLSLRASASSMRKSLAAVVVATLFTALMFGPVFAARPFDADSGYRAFGAKWEMNDALFTVLAGVVRSASGVAKLTPEGADRIARLLAAGMVLLSLTALIRAPMSGGPDFCNRIGIALGAAFMLSPAQFPWYYLWMVPFLALRPRASLLLLSLVLPLYYLKFYFAAHGQVELFHTWIVWIEFAPVIALAAWEAWTARRTRALAV
jgi:hypothetical protein